MNISYQLDSFEGPLDLLLRLIEKNKVSVTDIPIAMIFRQYMEQLEKMKRMDMEVTGEFIVMASELMVIKSKMLLPKSKTETDPRADLAAALAEYQKIREAAIYLGEQMTAFSGRVTKDTDEVTPEKGTLAPQNVESLRSAMLLMMRSMNKEQVERVNRENAERPFETILHAPIVPVSGKIFGVIRYLYRNGDTLFTSLLLTADTKSELIATFLAMLELMKNNRVTLYPVSADSSEEAEDYYVILNREKSKHEI